MVYLFISSENAQYGDSNNFTVNVNNYLDGLDSSVIQFRLLKCMIEGGIQNVSTNNVLWINQTYLNPPSPPVDTEYSIIIPPGNYNINTLATAIQTGVRTSTSMAQFTCTANSSTGLLTLATNNSSYVFEILGGNQYPLNINEIIGFDSNSSTQSESSITSPNIIDLSGCDKILIRSNITRGTVFWDRLDAYSDIVDVIYPQQSGYENIVYEPIRPLLHSTQGMSTINFRLTDGNGNLIRLNGKNWSMLLEIITD